MTSPGQGVIDFFYHPRIENLHAHLDHLGPFLDNVELTRWLDGPAGVGVMQYVSATYGVIVTIGSGYPIPPDWSTTTGWVSDDGQYEEKVYTPPLGQIVVQHQFTGTTLYVTTQSEWVDRFPHLIMWEHSFPSRIGLYMQPHIAFDLLYLTITP
jgi:hypothetical protein